MAQARLKGSFIYLANAVNDLRGNWLILGTVLAPLVLVASLCLLPDAVNLQYRLAQMFEPGVRSVSMAEVQTPYPPPAAPMAGGPVPFPKWFTTTLHLLFGVITLVVTLVVLCTMLRIRTGRPRAETSDEAKAIYRQAIALAPAFLWVVFLQFVVPVIVGITLPWMWLNVARGLLALIGTVLLVVPAVLLLIWLYFSQYALIFGDHHGPEALLFSRNLMRGRFLATTVRIVVFGAVWSGFNSWAYVAFIVVSVLLGTVGVLTGFFWAAIFVAEFLAVAVTHATTAFFIAAGVRLYQDLTLLASESRSVAEAAAVTRSSLSTTAG